MKISYLNTSHVNLQRMEVVFPCPGSPNLNTSHVNLQQAVTVAV